MSTDLVLPGAPQLPIKLQKKLEKAIMAWLEHLEPHTQRSYRRGLIHFAEWLGEEGAIELQPAPVLRAPDRQSWEDEAVAVAGRYLLGLKPPNPSLVVQGFMEELVYPSEASRESYTRTTAGTRLAALRWAVREARRMGQISWDLEVDLPKVKKDKSGRLKEKKGRDMKGPTKAEAKMLLAAAKADVDPRTWFLMSVLRYEGFREHEIRQLDFDDIDLSRRVVSAVRKKRDKAADYPFSSYTIEALKTWLKVRGSEPGPLLYGGFQGGNPAKRIGETTIYFLVQRVAAEAKLKTSPHKIRHRACTDIVQASIKLGLPEEEILFLTGHSSRQALQPYYEASKSRKNARQVLDSLDDLIDEDDTDG